MIYIYKDEKQPGKFYFQLTVDDLETGKKKKYKKRGFSSEKEARKAAMNFVSDQNTKKFNGIQFDVIIEEFISFKRKRNKETSVQRIERVYRRYILPYVKGKYMNRFTALDAENFYNHILSLNLSVNNTNWIISQFKRIFKYAETYYSLGHNPTLRLEYLKEAIQPIDPLDLYTQKEFAQYIDTFDEATLYEKSFKLFFVILFYTGARRGEAKAVKWNDIDFENKLLRIDEQATDKDPRYQVLITPQLKNPQSYRKIPLDDRTLKMLSDLKAELINKGEFNFNDVIFNRRGSKLPLADSTIYNRNKRAAIAAGVKYINIHAFRHSYASNLLSIGVPITAVSSALGHSNIGVTQKVYLHVIKRDKEQLFEKLNLLRNTED